MANYYKSKGRRTKKGTRRTDNGRLHVFMGLQVFDHVYDSKKHAWIKPKHLWSYIQHNTLDYSIHSVKAAERYIMKHNEIPKGTVCELWSEFSDVPNVTFVK